MHLRLIKGLSYDGVVRASAAHPDVFVDDPEKYTALLESGYFEALPDAHTVTGHLDATSSARWTRSSSTSWLTIWRRYHRQGQGGGRRGRRRGARGSP